MTRLKGLGDAVPMVEPHFFTLPDFKVLEFLLDIVRSACYLAEK